MYAGIISSMLILFSAFEYSGGEPASLFPFTTASENYSLPGVYLNPLSAAENNGLTLSAYCSRPYSEDLLHSYTSGIKYSENGCGLQFLWSSFGTDFYSEDRFTAGTGLNAWGFLTSGISGSAYRLSIEAEDESYSRTMYDADFALSIAPVEAVSLSCIQSCVTTALTGNNRMELYPERSAGVTLRPSHGFSLSWNITDTAAGYVNSFTAGITPAPFFSLRGAYTPEDSRFAASLSLVIKKINVSYSISSHPCLGYTHSLGVSCFTNCKIDTLRYGKPAIVSPERKTDISTASDYELRNLPYLSSRSAERIILYRKKYGPVTEKSLTQLGLSKDEIDSVKSNCYGLARGSEDEKEKKYVRNRRKKTGTYIPPKERVKERFRRMIKSGIPASSAIRYSELPETSRRSDLEALLDSDRTLTDEQKESVRRICAE